MAIDDELNNEPDQHPIHYLFQHQSLPHALFENHPKLMQELFRKQTESMPLEHFWSREGLYYLNQMGEKNR